MIPQIITRSCSCFQRQFCNTSLSMKRRFSWSNKLFQQNDMHLRKSRIKTFLPDIKEVSSSDYNTITQHGRAYTPYTPSPLHAGKLYKNYFFVCKMETLNKRTVQLFVNCKVVNFIHITFSRKTYILK